MEDKTVAIMREAEQRWDTLTIKNDFVFCKTMMNPELCKEVLEAILDIPIERIEYIEHQLALNAQPTDKSVRLDVYVRDGMGTAYNVEMQVANTHELPRRTRFYQSLMALDQIKKGEPYSALGDSYVIFICGFDPFHLGERVYFFENTCRTRTDLVLGDGAKTVFLAATPAPQDCAPTKLDEFLNYVSSGAVTGELSSRLDSEVARVLDNSEWRLEFMILEVRDQLNFDRGVIKGRELGLQEGLEQGRSQGIAQSQARMATLLNALHAAGQDDRVAEIAASPESLERLFEEFSIE